MTLQQLFTNFDGRINRQTFWIAFAMFFAVSVVLYIVFYAAIGSLLLYWLVSLPFLYPAAAVACKRLHDMGQTGWLALLGLIPLVNLGVLVWLGAVEGNPADNAYGPPFTGKVEFKWA